jgi:hypothetical protein
MSDNKYLTKQKIEELKNFLNKHLDTKTRVILLKLKNDHNIVLMSDSKTNMQKMWTLALSEIESKPDWKQKMLAENAKDLFLGSARIIRQYLDFYFKTEWGFAQFFNYDEIQTYLTKFCNENYVAVLRLPEILECKNYDELLNTKYSEKQVSKESREKTEKIKILIDTLFQNHEIGSNEWYSINNALECYKMEKDGIKLHNLLNTVLKW